MYDLLVHILVLFELFLPYFSLLGVFDFVPLGVQNFVVILVLRLLIFGSVVEVLDEFLVLLSDSLANILGLDLNVVKASGRVVDEVGFSLRSSRLLSDFVAVVVKNVVVHLVDWLFSLVIFHELLVLFGDGLVDVRARLLLALRQSFLLGGVRLGI